MVRALPLFLSVVFVGISIGCGGGDQPPAASSPEVPAAVSDSSDVSAAATTPAGTDASPTRVEDGPGSGSEFDVPPNLGSAEPNADTAPAGNTEPEFKLPPSAGN